jgi:hypothetical protein
MHFRLQIPYAQITLVTLLDETRHQAQRDKTTEYGTTRHYPKRPDQSGNL